MPQKIKRTFLDTNVVVAACKSTRPHHEKAIKLLRDDSRDFLATSLVELELSQPHHDPRFRDEAEFYVNYLENIVTERADVTESIIADGIATVKRTGAAAMDAMHLACARHMKADELITAEKKSKPIYRERGISVIYLGDL